MDSILNSVKKVLGLDEVDEGFDIDILMHINSMFMVLNQLGIGPENGFAIGGAEEVWADFIGDDAMLAAVKTYIWLRVRMLFDPPSTSFHIDAMQKQIAELEWRLNTYREGKLHPLIEITPTPY
jgi:hypothetical protein